MDSTAYKEERRVADEEFERVARDYPQFAQSYLEAREALVAKELELENLRAKNSNGAETATEGVRIVLNALGTLTLLLSLVLVVVLPLAEKIVYFYLGRLSFVEKEGLLTILQALALYGAYRAYRFRVDRNVRR